MAFKRYEDRRVGKVHDGARGRLEGHLRRVWRDGRPTLRPRRCTSAEANHCL